MIYISIHVPTRGTTVITKNDRITSWDFNPRSHEGNDGIRHNEPCRLGISIHVPTRGTTVSFLLLSVRRCNFNPRSHEGNDNP